MDQAIVSPGPAGMDRLLQSIKNEARRGRSADLPAHDPAGKGIDHESDVDEPRLGVDIGRIDHLQRIGSADCELPVDLVLRARRLGIADGSNAGFTTPYACQPHRPLHRALGHSDPFASQLVLDLPGAVEANAGFMDTPDLLPHLVIAPGTSRAQLRIDKTGRMFVPGGRGNWQFAAHRLDTQFPVMSVDELHHHLPWRHEFRLAPPEQNMQRPCTGSRWPGAVPSPRARAASSDPGHCRPAPQSRSLLPTPSRNRSGAHQPFGPPVREPQAKICSLSSS